MCTYPQVEIDFLYGTTIGQNPASLHSSSALHPLQLTLCHRGEVGLSHCEHSHHGAKKSAPSIQNDDMINEVHVRYCTIACRFMRMNDLMARRRAAPNRVNSASTYETMGRS